MRPFLTAIILGIMLLTPSHTSAASPAFSSGGPEIIMCVGEEKVEETDPAFVILVNYVLDTLGALSDSKKAALAAVGERYKGGSIGDYRMGIRKLLHVNDTIDVAIKDLWYKNRVHYPDETEQDKVVYAVEFVRQYYQEGSRVDVWPPGAYEGALKRIEAAERKQ